jgi:hypothetical protein
MLLGLGLLACPAFDVSAQNPQPKAKVVNDALPDPDGKPADVSKTVKVFILLGQSNMLEMGQVVGDKDGTLEYAVKTEGLYPFLVDDAGKWTTRQDVRNVAVMGSGGPGKTQVRVNNWLTVSGGKVGVEMSIGHHLGNALEEPVLILKSAIGNRSLGWDLLPPGSPSYEFTDPKDGKTYVYAGSGESPDKFAISDPKKHPELQGSVATLYTHPLRMGSSSNAHYGGNAKTYMNVGLGMGEAMVKLIKESK